MENNEQFDDIFGSLDELLSQTKLDDVTAESTGFENLPDGYYQCEVEKAELKVSKSSHKPMASFQFKVVENGKAIDDDGEISEIRGTQNRKVFLNYVLADEKGVKRFATDMLKFEGEEPGVPILEKECFTNSELISDALEILVGMRIYIHVQTTENKDGTSSTWQNLISWKRVAALEI